MADDTSDTPRPAESNKRRKLTTTNFPDHYRYPGKPAPTANFRTALQTYLVSDDDSNEYVFYRDEDCVVIYDGYPKARFHLLLIPRMSNVHSIADLTKDLHLEALQKCHTTARTIVDHLTHEYERKFGHACPGIRMGYHSIPSLDNLHLHIISSDLDSPCLKNKKHYNSFASSFFVEVDLLEQQLVERGTIRLDMDAETKKVKQPLRCFRCGLKPRNLPDLKKHLASPCKPAND